MNAVHQNKVEPIAKNRENKRCVTRLEAHITSIKQNCVHIDKATRTSDIAQIILRLRKEDRVGWIDFPSKNSPN